MIWAILGVVILFFCGARILRGVRWLEARYSDDRRIAQFASDVGHSDYDPFLMGWPPPPGVELPIAEWRERFTPKRP